MKRTLLILALALLAIPCARAQVSYYVDCVNGSNSNAGTSPGTAWKGLHAANSAAFNGGDSLFLKRGCVWNWYLTPPVTASGTSVFTIDAYGNGAPPTLQNEVAVPTSSPATAWVAVSGHTNVYAIPVYSPSEGTGYSPYRIDAVKLNGIWGNCVGMNDAANDDQYCGSTSATTGVAALTANGQWYYDGTYSQGGSYGGGRNCTSQTNPTGNPNGDCGNLYVYSSTGAPTNVTVTLDGSTNLIKIAGLSYITVQHVRLLNYSWYGIEVSGASDNLIFDNIFADTEVPFNFHGTGFYLHPSGTATSIQLLNTESHRGYYGYQIGLTAGGTTMAANAVTLSNCKSYFNRDAALADLTVSGLSVAYDHCHFYGNGVGSPIPNDISIDPNTSACTGSHICTPGGTAGVGNIAPNTDPKVISWANYTPRFTLQYRGPGYAFGSDAALNLQLSALGSAPLSIGIGTNYSFSAGLIPQFNTWLADGYDLNLMGLSAASYANAGTLTILYASGNCTTTALTITGTPATSLAIVASGGGSCPGGDSFTIPITSTMTLGGSGGLKSLLAAHPNYTVAWVQPCGSCAWVDGSAMLAQDLATASSAYVGPVGGGFVAPGYFVLLNPDQFLKDETSLSQDWVQTNLTGWGSTWVYLYPGTLFNPTALGVTTIEQDVSGTAGSYQSPNFAGAVGANTMQLGRDGLSGAFDAVGPNGVDAQGLTTYSLSGWNTLSPLALQAAIQSAVEKAAIWGVPQTLYWQSGDLTNQQLSLIVADLQASGATLMTDSALVNFLTTSPRVQVASLPLSSGFCSCWAWTPETGIVNLRPTYLSPTVGTANGTVCASYPIDLNGVTQPQTWSATNAKTSAVVSKTGCDIGAQALVPSFTGLRPGH